MSLLRSIASGLRSLFRKEQVDQELNEELSAYLEMAAEEKMKDGMSRKDARRAVRLEQGSLEVTKETVRSAAWEFFMETRVRCRRGTYTHTRYWRDGKHFQRSRCCVASSPSLSQREPPCVPLRGQN
jgi:hypothetical protein